MALVWMLVLLCGVVYVRAELAGCAAGCTCTNSQTITGCEHAQLSTIPAEIPRTSIILNFDYNIVPELGERSLSNLTSLEILTLRYNRIITIQKNAFENLRFLRILSLQANRIAQLPKHLFISNKQLEYVDLSHNALMHVPHEAFYHLFNMQILNVSYNQILSAFLGPGFQYTTKLRILDLTGNDITTLEEESFKEAEWWTQGAQHIINMSACNLRYIESGALRTTGSITGFIFSDNLNIPHLFLKNIFATKLKQLDLSNTRLSTMRGYLDNPHLQQLEDLSLARNALSEIGSGDFKYMENLKSLDLSQNMISSIKNFNGLTRLEHLDLSSNRISQLNITTFEGVNFRSLYLQYNNISHLSDELFSDLFYLEILDLSYNNIGNFQLRAGLEYVRVLKLVGNRLDSVTFLSMLVKLEELDVSNNAIKGVTSTTFQQSQVIRTANFSHNRITAIEPLSFQLSTLQVLDLSHNLISNLAHFGWKTPLKEIYLANNGIRSIARDAFRGLSSLEILDLSYCGLKEIPGFLFDGLFHLKTLLLTGNPLGHFPASEGAKTAFAGLPSIQYIALNSANLKELPVSVCANKTSLRHIDISENHIAKLHDGMCNSVVNLRTLNIANNELQRVDFKALDCLHSLEVIDLSHNPYACSCDFLPTCDWLQQTHIHILHQSEANALVCGYDSTQTVSDYCSASHVGCDMQTHPMLWALVAGAAVFLIVMILFCSWRMYMRYRKKRKLSRMMDREMEIQREKMLMQSQINQFYFKEESL